MTGGASKQATSYSLFCPFVRALNLPVMSHCWGMSQEPTSSVKSVVSLLRVTWFITPENEILKFKK